MCGGVRYTHNGSEYTVYFPQPGAELPVRLHGGDTALLTWGRRDQEPGALPPGGWARLESIKQGRWDRYFPIPVRLILIAFMEKNRQGRTHWYPLVSGTFVQGLVATEGEERRVYVVTIQPTLPDQAVIHERWPRIVLASDVVTNRDSL